MNRTEDPLFVEEDMPIRDTVARDCRVATVTGHTSTIDDDVPSPDGFKSHLLVYDKAGHRARHEKFDRDGQPIRRWLYDDAGKPVQDIAYDKSGDVDYWFDFIYEGNAWTEKRMYSPPDRLHYRIIANRETGGRLAHAIYRDANGTTLRSDRYMYDVDGLLVRVDVGHMGECLYGYDRSGTLKSKSISRPGASVFGDAYEFEHDRRGLLTRITHLHFSITLLDFVFFERSDHATERD